MRALFFLIFLFSQEKLWSQSDATSTQHQTPSPLSKLDSGDQFNRMFSCMQAKLDRQALNSMMSRLPGFEPNDPMDTEARKRAAERAAEVANRQINQKSLIGNDLSKANFQKLKAYWGDQLDAMGAKTPEEFAHIFAQIIPESQGFRSLVERSLDSTDRECWRQVINDGLKSCDDRFNDMTSLISSSNQEYAARKCAQLEQKRDTQYFRNKSYGAKWRGRGPIQITGCSNYMTFLHYLNSGVWNEYWPIRLQNLTGEERRQLVPVPQQNNTHQLNMACTDRVVEAFKEQYQQRFGRQLDPYNILDNLDAFAAPCSEFTNSETGEKVTAAELMVKSIFGFLNGRCRQSMATISKAHLKHRLIEDGAQEGTPEFSQRFSRLNACFDGRPTSARVDCLERNLVRYNTRCVNGGFNGLDARNNYYKRAMECANVVQ